MNEYCRDGMGWDGMGWVADGMDTPTPTPTPIYLWMPGKRKSSARVVCALQLCGVGTLFLNSRVFLRSLLLLLLYYYHYYLLIRYLVIVLGTCKMWIYISCFY